jgi:hypothetical protein
MLRPSYPTISSFSPNNLQEAAADQQLSLARWKQKARQTEVGRAHWWLISGGKLPFDSITTLPSPSFFNKWNVMTSSAGVAAAPGPSTRGRFEKGSIAAETQRSAVTAALGAHCPNTPLLSSGLLQYIAVPPPSCSLEQLRLIQLAVVRPLLFRSAVKESP